VQRPQFERRARGGVEFSRACTAEMLLRLANRMAFTVDPLPVPQADW
jgi:hypothetical protein